jgi:DNA anti-recombination protein RmuC
MTPWAVILGIDAYEDLLDQLDTMAEQIDPDFQRSLQQSMEENRRGDVGTMEDIRRILRRKEKGRA